jgi:PAS domain S-box-containing protein
VSHARTSIEVAETESARATPRLSGRARVPRVASEHPVYRVLLVDDIQEERDLLGLCLEETSRFVVVGQAGDGPRGAALVAELRPDLVTLDMSMPGGDGITALREMRAASPESKVVIVSGLVGPETVHSTVDLLGASACLDKRIGLEKLTELLLAVVDGLLGESGPTHDLGRPQDVVEGEFVTEARLAAIVTTSEDAIIGKTLDGTVTDWNAGAEHLYGYTAAEMEGKNISVLVPKDTTEELPAILERVRRGERIAHRETRRIRKDGTSVDVSLAISPILDLSGNVVGASTVARDISSRRAAEAVIARQSEDLRRSNDELRQFAYVASHDLSEPLRTISGYVELLARRYRGQIDDDADRFIQHTVDGCNRMRQLIDDLLAYAQAGRAEESTAEVDCTNVVDVVVAGMSAGLVEMDGLVEHDDLPTVYGDRSQLLQLFQNLIANGIKFARPGVAPRIRIEARPEDDDWIFSVTDNGIGIEPEYRDRIFVMFQRLHARNVYPGTGIGLAICMRIVLAHRGRIWVEDHSELGSRFCFSLPSDDPGSS